MKYREFIKNPTLQECKDEIEYYKNILLKCKWYNIYKIIICNLGITYYEHHQDILERSLE